jgi:glucose-6-phosphate isomerase
MPDPTPSPAWPVDVSLLQFETENVFCDAVGSEGLTREALTALTPALTSSHEQLAAGMRGGWEAEFACLNLAALMPESLPEIRAEAARLARFRHILLIGIGGSSLGAKAVYRALVPEPQWVEAPRLHFVENIDPTRLAVLLAHLPPEETAVIAISKSGGTLESVVNFLCVRAWLEERLGRNQARRHQWVVTDPAQGWLRELAEREGLPALPVPPRVGGRYSVLTAVGLLPLAAVGLDVEALLAGAAANAARCTSPTPETNPALALAAIYYLLDAEREKRLAIMMPYADALSFFGDWYRQLWAESLGKARPDRPPAGTLPVTALGAVDQHSQLQMYLESRHDKFFTFLALARWPDDLAVHLPEAARARFPYLEGKRLSEVLEAEFLATRAVITQAGHPNLTLRLPVLDAHTLGQLIDLYQRVTVYAGLLYGVDPLDQPAVERGKRLAVEQLSRR